MRQLFILICSSTCLAAGVSHETYKDLIAKAQNLSLQKDRLQATKILSRAANREKGDGRKEILASLKELSEVFYSNKGQQVYELGQSIRLTNYASALEKYTEALSLEPNNTAVLKAIANSHMNLGQCDKAGEMAVQGLQINPFDQELVLLNAQANVCLSKIDYAKLVQELIDLKKPPVKLHADLLKARVLKSEGKFPAAEAQLEKAIATDPRFPESYYQLALIRQATGKDSQEAYSRYVSLCAEPQIDIKKRYFLEPRLCFEKPKAEAELEKLKVQQKETL